MLFTYPAAGKYDFDKLILSKASAVMVLFPSINNSNGTVIEELLVAKAVELPLMYQFTFMVFGMVFKLVTEKETGLVLVRLKVVVAGK